MEPGLAAAVLAAMPIERAAHILGQPGFDQPQRLVERLPIDRAAAILSAMLADRRADIVRRLSEPLRAQLCAKLEEPLRRSLLELLAYPPGTAGAIMTTEFVSVDADWTAARALEHIRSVGAGSETIYAIYVVDPAEPAAPARAVAAPADPRRSAGTRRRDRAGPPAADGLARDRSRGGGAPHLQIRPAGRAGGGRRRPGGRHRDRRRRDRRHRAGGHRGRAEVRRHGGARPALPADRLRAR